MQSVESILHFYENIPDVNEINHLTDEEFQNTLQSLKSIHKSFFKCPNEDLKSEDNLINEDILCTGLEQFSIQNSPEQRFLSFSENKEPGDDGVPCQEPLIETQVFKDNNFLTSSRPTQKMKNNDDIPSILSMDSYRYKSFKHKTDSENQEFKLKQPLQKSIFVPDKRTYNQKSLKQCKNLVEYLSSDDRQKAPNKNIDYSIENEYNDSGSSLLDNIWDKCSINEFMSKEDEADSIENDILLTTCPYSIGLPCSPILKRKCKREKSNPLKITVPKPFKMTVREEENAGLNSIKCDLHRHCNGDDDFDTDRKVGEKVHPIPIESSVPLFDKIMAQQNARRRRIHKRNSAQLQAMVQPFSFTKKDEETQRMRLTCSNPDVSTSRPAKHSFKAKPVPKNLFSNYAYERMREDEFYRALKKKVRSEEMLKAASLPPSMAARENSMKIQGSKCLFEKGRQKKYKKFKPVHKCESLTDDSICPNHRPSRPQVRRQVQAQRSVPSPYESTSELEPRPRARSHSSLSSNRNNLAAVLRIQASRKRIELEMARRIEESQLQDQARFKARLVRMTPAWRALDFSTEEDLAMRVASRREEERIKQEEHRRLMDSMFGRVHRIPHLFERPTRRPNSNKANKQNTKNTITHHKNLILHDSVLSENDSQLSEVIGSEDNIGTGMNSEIDGKNIPSSEGKSSKSTKTIDSDEKYSTSDEDHHDDD